MKRILKHLSSSILLLCLALIAEAQVSDRSVAFEFNRNLGKGANFMASKIQGEYFYGRDAEVLLENHFSHIRIGDKLNLHTTEAPEFTITPSRLDYLQSVVDIALEKGLLVVLDPLHQFNEFYTDAELPKLKKIWSQVAVRFAEYPAKSLCFEIMNEPHSDNKLFDLVNESLAEIRAVPGNEERMVIASGQGFSTRQAVINAFDNDIFPPDDPNIIGTFHYYDPRDFSKQGTFEVKVEWGETGDNDPAWKVTEDALNEVRSANTRWAERNNTIPIPIYLGEYGVDNYAPPESRKRWYWWVRNNAERLGYSHAFWNMYNNSPGSKGLGPWTSLEKSDPSSRYLDPYIVDALQGRYEAEDGIEKAGALTILDVEGASEGSVKLTSGGSGVTFPGIYIGKSGSYNLYTRYRSETTENQMIKIMSKGDDAIGFSPAREVLFPPTDSGRWGHVIITVEFDTMRQGQTRLELSTDGEVEIDFIAISSGLFSQYLFPSEQFLATHLKRTYQGSPGIFPNPATTAHVRVDLPGELISDQSKITITDLNGRTVIEYDISASGTGIELPDYLENGLYILSFSDVKNRSFMTARLAVIRQ